MSSRSPSAPSCGCPARRSPCRATIACTRRTGALSFGRRVEALPFSQDFELHGGSYWHTIRRECGEVLLDFVDENPTIVDYFRHVILPDETFIQTRSNTKRFRISPYTSSDITISAIRTMVIRRRWVRADLGRAFASQCYFGRKFDMASHPEVLDALDARVLGQIERTRHGHKHPCRCRSTRSRGRAPPQAGAFATRRVTIPTSPCVDRSAASAP